MTFVTSDIIHVTTKQGALHRQPQIVPGVGWNARRARGQQVGRGVKFPLRSRVVQREPVTARQRIGKSRHAPDAAHDEYEPAVRFDQHVRAHVIIRPTRVADERVGMPLGSPADADLRQNLAQAWPWPSVRVKVSNVPA